MSKRPIKLLIVDDNELFVSALEGLLDNDASVRVVGERRTGPRQRCSPRSCGPMSF